MAAAAVETGSAPPVRQPYFVGRRVDAAVVGGLAILAWGGTSVFLAITPEGSQTWGRSLVDQWVVWLALLLNYPHFVASVLPLYRSREGLRQHAATAVALPVLVGFGILMAMHHPIAILPFFCKIALWWLGFHISLQTLGLSLLYARRAGVSVDKTGRILLGCFIFATFLYASLLPECRESSGRFLGLELPSLRLPQSFKLLGVIALLAGVAALIAFAVRARPPVILLLPAFAQFLCWVPPTGSGYQSFFDQVALFGLFHGLQYLFLAWQVQLQERRERPPPSRRAEPDKGQTGVRLRGVGWESLRYGAILVVVGTLVIVGFPTLFHRIGIPLHIAEPALLAGLFVHHALVDGVLWKPRTPAARRLATLRLQNVGRSAR